MQIPGGRRRKRTGKNGSKRKIKSKERKMSKRDGACKRKGSEVKRLEQKTLRQGTT